MRRLLQLGNSSIMIGTQFDKAFLDPGFVFCIGLGNLIIQRADFALVSFSSFCNFVCA